MVKRDSKERTLRKEDEDEDEHSPPPPLPRGNYQNVHDFFKQSHSLPRNQQSLSDDSGLGSGTKWGSQQGINKSHKASFKLGDYYKKMSKKDERPSSALSAHERLFGSSRENSLSPTAGSSTSSSSNSVNKNVSFHFWQYEILKFDKILE